MPTLTIETGSANASGNSYVSVGDLTSYLSDRGLTWSGNNGAQDVALIQAMDYLESRSFIGNKSTKEQPLQWPRSNVYIDGYFYQSSEIPELVKKAQMEIAIAIDAGNNPSAVVGRKTKREKVGSVEVEYSDSSDDSVELTAVNQILRKLSSAPVSSKVGSVLLSRA